MFHFVNLTELTFLDEMTFFGERGRSVSHDRKSENNKKFCCVIKENNDSHCLLTERHSLKC